MHSSRMRTGRSLTVYWSLLPGGGGVLVWGVSALGGCLLPGGVWSQGGLLWGVSAPGGIWSQRGLLWGGVSGLEEGVFGPGGVCSGGVSAPGGVCSRGVSAGNVCIPACTEADTPLLTESQTPVKILPWPNFVAAGKNSYLSNFKNRSFPSKLMNLIHTILPVVIFPPNQSLGTDAPYHLDWLGGKYHYW